MCPPLSLPLACVQALVLRKESWVTLSAAFPTDSRLILDAVRERLVLMSSLERPQNVDSRHSSVPDHTVVYSSLLQQVRTLFSQPPRASPCTSALLGASFLTLSVW